MNIIIYCKNRQLKFLTAFLKGLYKHNQKANLYINNFDPNSIKTADLVVGWGVKSRVYKIRKQLKKDIIVLERGYLGDRYNWTSCGFNGLNGEADFLNNQVGPERWDNIFSKIIEVKEWKKNGEYALLTGQVSNDASVRQYKIYDIYTSLIKQLNYMNIPVVFREHPLSKTKFSSDINLKYIKDTNKNIVDTLANARLTLTINSNAGVDSLVNGVPVFSLDKKSMVYKYSSHSLQSGLFYPDRLPWLHRMSYTQWLPSEIENGDTWEHLKQKYN